MQILRDFFGVRRIDVAALRSALGGTTSLTLAACAWSVAVFSGPSALASDFDSPRAAALGGAGSAGPLLNDSIQINPAFIGILRTYGVSVNYLYYSGVSTDPVTGDPSEIGKTLNVSVQDGHTDIFQAAASYTQTERARIVHAVVSKAASRRVSFGLGGKWVDPSELDALNFIEPSISVAYIHADYLQFGLQADNLIQSPAATRQGVLRNITLGTKLNIEGLLLLYADPVFTPDAPIDARIGLHAAIEVPIFKDFYIRVGNFRSTQIPHDGRFGSGWATGVGWLAPRLSLDYAFVRTHEPVGTTAHVFGATAFF